MDLTQESTQVRLASSDGIIRLLKLTARTKIEHVGDYGNLFWNEQEGKVHWTMGDADSDGTSSQDIEKLFMKIDGVREVIIGDEWSPHNDPDWEEIKT